MNGLSSQIQCSFIDTKITLSAILTILTHPLTFDLSVIDCLRPLEDYTSTDFGVDSSSRFPFRALTATY